MMEDVTNEPDNELPPRFLGFCIGVPGYKSCGNRVTEADVMAVVIPGMGPIGDCCQPYLLYGMSWSSHLDGGPTAAKAAAKKAAKKIVVPSTAKRRNGARQRKKL